MEMRAAVERAAAMAATTPLWPGFRFEALSGTEWPAGHPAPEPYQLLSAAWRHQLGMVVAEAEGYPVHDPVNNALAIVENQQLIAALAGDGLGLGRFLSVRLHRQKRLGRTGAAAVVAYEQRVEWAEGVPTYIELRAGRPQDHLVAGLREANAGGRGAAFERFAWSGAAQALLLDRVAPGWQGEAGGRSLQELLLAAVGEIPAVGGVVKAVGFTEVLEREEQFELARRERS